MEEKQNLSKKINFSKLIHYFMGESGPKSFIGFNGLLGFYKKYKGWSHNTSKGRRKKTTRKNYHFFKSFF